MFFEQLLDLTPKDHGDYLNIKAVLDKILYQANEANRVLKLRQSTEKLEALQKRFVGKNVPVSSQFLVELKKPRSLSTL